MGSVGGGQSPSADYFMSQAPANYQRAQGIANAPFTPYTGQLSPGVAPQIAQATQIAGGVGSYQPQQVTPTMARAPTASAASSGVYGLQMGAPAPVTPAQAAPLPPRPDVQGMPRDQRRDALQQWRMDRRAARGPGGGGDVGQAPGLAPGAPAVNAMQGLQGLEGYMNPYLQNVADRTLADLDRFRQMSLNSNEAQANMAGAWGNSRLGVENALTNEGFANQAASALANLYSGGFNTSADLLGQDKNRLLQNQQFNAGLQQQSNLANQQAALTTNLANQQVGLQGQALNQGAGLEGARLNLAAAPVLGQLGGLQFNQEQSGMNAAYQEFLRQQAYPAQQQQLINQTLGLVPYQWAGPGQNPFTSAFAGYAGKSLGQGLGGGGADLGLQLLGLGG